MKKKESPWWLTCWLMTWARFIIVLPVVSISSMSRRRLFCSFSGFVILKMGVW